MVKTRISARPRPARKGLTWLVVALAAFCASGCGTTATIRGWRGNIEGRILGGGPETIRVRATNGSIRYVRRRSISEIDHPGNVWAIIGTVLTTLVVVGAAATGRAGAGCDTPTDGNRQCYIGLYGLIASVPMAAWGYLVWGRSVKAAGRRNQAAPVGYEVLPRPNRKPIDANVRRPNRLPSWAPNNQPSCMTTCLKALMACKGRCIKSGGDDSSAVTGCQQTCTVRDAECRRRCPRKKLAPQTQPTSAPTTLPSTMPKTTHELDKLD